MTDACACVTAVDFNCVQFCNKRFESVSKAALTERWGVCGWELLYILFVLKHFFLTFQEVNVHLPTSWSQGTQVYGLL